MLLLLSPFKLAAQDNSLPELTIQEAAPLTLSPSNSGPELTESVLTLGEEASVNDTEASATDDKSAVQDGL